MKILAAEDDPVSRLILRRSVEKLGHECLTAQDGEQAWALYNENPDVDVIISDWMMPGVDGLELCRRVRREDRDGYTYFIFLTALGDKEHLLMGFEAGADDYLSKPLEREELQVRLISASRLTALHRQLAEQKTRMQRLNARLAEQARTDPLTGLGNRLRMREDLDALLARSSRYGYGYCAILCDVDHFKLYNDAYGHLAGDDVLKLVAETLSGMVRGGDAVYRYGGEEFLALLSGQSSCTGAAERLRKGVEELKIPHGAKDQPGPLTISAGICASSAGEHPHSKTPDQVLKEADDALYRAKEAGRNRVVIGGSEG